MKTETYEMELSLEHINPDLIDVVCDVEIEAYHGSGDIDDPSEIDIISITNLNQITHSLNGAILLYENDDIKLDKQLESQITKNYERLQNS